MPVCRKFTTTEDRKGDLVNSIINIGYFLIVYFLFSIYIVYWDLITLAQMMIGNIYVYNTINSRRFQRKDL